MTFTHDNLSFKLHALVVEDLDVDVLGSVPFTDCTDITIRTAKHLVFLSDGSHVQYGSNVFNSDAIIRHTQIYLLRAPSTTTLWPGKFLALSIPYDAAPEGQVALEPRTESDCYGSWLRPGIINSGGETLRVCNTTDDPILLKKHQHFGQISPVYTPTLTCESIGIMSIPSTKETPFSSSVQIVPDSKLSPDVKHNFRQLLEKYGEVFDPKFRGYNGVSSKYEARVNIGPVQTPPRKGRLPQYNKSKLMELQQKCDDLDDLGVLRKPKDIDIVAEYHNSSFMVKKPSRHFRLVTAFAEVGRYSKPQPALMRDIDSTLRQIAQWRYIVISPT